MTLDAKNIYGNTANIYNQDVIEEYVKKVKTLGYESLEPIEWYQSESDGITYIVDGHHRAAALLVCEIPLEKWKAYNTSEENVLGIEFVNWESFEDVIKKTNQELHKETIIRKEHALENVTILASLSEEQKKIMGISKEQLDTLIKERLPTEILPQILKRVIPDCMGNLDSIKVHYDTNSMGEFQPPTDADRDPVTSNTVVLGEFQAQWQDPSTTKKHPVTIEIAQKNYTMYQEGKEYKRKAFTAVITECPPGLGCKGSIVGEVLPQIKGKYIQVDPSVRGQSIGSMLLHLYNQEYYKEHGKIEKGIIGSDDGKKMIEKYYKIRKEVIDYVSQEYNKAVPRHYEKQFEQQKATPTMKTISLFGVPVSYDFKKLKTEIPYVETHLLLQKSEMPSDESLKKIPRRITGGELLSLLEEKKYCNILKRHSELFKTSENIAELLNGYETVIDKKIKMVHDLLLFDLTEGRLRHTKEVEVNSYLQQILDRVPKDNFKGDGQDSTFKTQTNTIKDLGNIKTADFSEEREYRDIKGNLYDICSNKDKTMIIAINTTTKDIAAAVVKYSNNSIRLFEGALALNLTSKDNGVLMACLHTYLTLRENGREIISTPNKNENESIARYFDLVKMVKGELPSYMKGIEERSTINTPPATPEKLRATEREVEK